MTTTSPNVDDAQSGMRATVLTVLPEIAELEDATLVEAVIDIWVEFWMSSAWDDLNSIPKNSSLPPSRTLVAHVRAVTQEAVQVAQTISIVHGLAVDMDIVRAGALLHDVCKLAETQPSVEGAASYSRLGELIQHGAVAASVVLQKGLPLELAHLILSHTPASAKPPATIEAWIVRYVDLLDSEVLALAERSRS
jgi:putative nucleotidyltransferase with HDIG domain